MFTYHTLLSIATLFHSKVVPSRSVSTEGRKEEIKKQKIKYEEYEQLQLAESIKKFFCRKITLDAWIQSLAGGRVGVSPLRPLVNKPLRGAPFPGWPSGLPMDPDKGQRLSSTLWDIFPEVQLQPLKLSSNRLLLHFQGCRECATGEEKSST